MEKIQNRVNNTIQTVKRHRAKIAVAGTAGTLIWLDRKRVKEWNQFLTEHDLFDTFYSFTE